MNDRSNVYRLLGLLWRREVSEALLSELCETGLREAFEAVGGSLPDSSSSAVDELAIDYCQLLIGPKGHLPPFQSVWQSGQLCGDATASMLQFIELAGYDVGHLSDGQLVDHFGVQLDLMAHLLDQAEMCPSSQQKAVEELLAGFAKSHLVWAVPFLEQARDKATTDFYRSLALVTRDFLQQEFEVLQPVVKLKT